MYEYGGAAYFGGRFKWDENSDTLIIKTIKREL